MKLSRPALRAVLLQLKLRRTFSYAHIRTVVTLAALGTFQPDILTFAFLLSHKILLRLKGVIS
jgi:hypothetical protein